MKNQKETIGLDCYNQTLTNNIAKPLTNAATDSDHIPCVIIIDHHPNDSRTRIADDQRNCQSLTSRMETGGGNIPLIMIKNTEEK